MEKVGLRGHVKLEVKDKNNGVVIDTVEVDNFITETYRRFIIDNTYSFITGNSVVVTTPSYCSRNGTDKSIKFALAVTDNDKVYSDAEKKALGDIEGNIITMTSCVKETGASDDSFIEYINYLENGGIEIKAVLREGKGDINAVNLVIPADFNYNTDLGGVYKGIIGEQLVNSNNNKSGDYINTRFVKSGDYVYWGYARYNPNTKCIINRYNIKTKEWIYVERTISKATGAVHPQVVDGELYVLYGNDLIEVFDMDLNYLRSESVKKTLSYATNGYVPECYHYFIYGDLLYVIDYIYTSSKYFKVGKTALSSSDKTDYVSSRTINYTDIDALKTILLGDWIEGTSYIRALNGLVYDVEQLFSISNISDWTPVEGVDNGLFEGRPAGLHRGIKIGNNNKWIGVHFKSHDINKLSGLYTSTTLTSGKHFCDNLVYADFGRYVTITSGGNALTHARLSQTVTKTEDNEIVLTYTIK